MLKKIKVSVVIPAAGSGKRMKAKVSKQFIKINKKEILAYTIEVFEKLEVIDQIVIVTGQEDIEYVEAIKEQYSYDKITDIVVGGKERQDSVYSGLQFVEEDTEIVLVHDGARPMIDEESIIKLIEESIVSEAAVLGVKVKDTIKVVNQDSEIIDTPKRDTLYAIQTPQGFSKNLLVNAYRKGIESGAVVTDDAMMVEIYGQHSVKVVEGNYGNIKLTTPEDLKVFEIFVENLI